MLSQRIALFTWIEPKHLDVPEGEGSEGFLMFAQQGWFLCLYAATGVGHAEHLTQSSSRSTTTRLLGIN